jgi:Ricin-type beta-trefoil lectin domain
MSIRMSAVCRLLSLALACGLLAALPPPARAQATGSPPPAPLVIAEGIRITPPPGWQEIDRTQNGFDLAKLPPAGPRDLLALAQITSEEREGHDEALERLADIAAEVPEPAELRVIGGWPAVVRQRVMPLSIGDPAAGPDEPTPPARLVEVRTIALAAAALVVRFDITLAPQGDERLLDEMQAAIERLEVAAVGEPAEAERELEQVARGVELRRQAQQEAPPPAPSAPEPSEPSEPLEPSEPSEPPAGSADLESFAAQAASQPAAAVQLRLGELQIEASADGRKVVVVANQGYAFSTDAGRTFTARSIPNPFPTGGDPTLGVGRSGSFYYSLIGRPDNGSAISVFKSTDSGSTFSFLNHAVSYLQNSGSSVDQPQLAVDRLNQANGKDQIYAVWRKMTAITAGFPDAVEQPRLVCSSDGGATFGAKVSVGTGLRPRVVVGGDGFVYVTYMTETSLLLNKFSSCANGLVSQKGFPITVTSYRPVYCPVVGLDRCSIGLSSPMVAVDDGRPEHVYIAWATSSAAGDSEEVKVADSLDGGKTFPRSVTVSGPAKARRFMPWICANRGIAQLGWYDRSTATGTNNDLTRYLGSTAGIDGTSLATGPRFQVSGVDDAQCRSWPCAPGQASYATSCSVQPQLAGICTSPPGKRCDYARPADCDRGATCQTRRGCPKYGDYNGIGCAAGSVFRAWAAATPPPGVTAPGLGIQLYARATTPRVVILKARHSNKCLDVPANSTADRTPLIQFTCNGRPNQQFEVVPIANGSSSQLVSRNSGKCLDIRGGSTADRALVQQLPCTGGTNQQFRIVDVGGGFRNLVVRNSGKCVDVEGASTADQAAVLQFTCNGQTNQQFLLQDVTP